MGEGMFYPTALHGAAEWFPPRSRAKAVGIVLCGLSVGALITPPIVAWLTLRYGWRAAFLVTGVSGFLLLVPWISIHHMIRERFGSPDPAPAFAGAEEVDSISAHVPLRMVLLRRKYLCLLAARALTDTAWYFFLFWIPGYFQEMRGYDLAAVGKRLWIPYLSADVGALVGAWVSSALIARGLGVDRSRKITLIASASLAAMGSYAYYAGSASLALGIVSLGLFGHLSCATNLHTAISEVAPPRFVALLYGITGASGTLLGAITQPLIGRTVDWVGYEPIFQSVGVLYITAAGLLLAAGKIERIGVLPPHATAVSSGR
jgi:ACS family hexuronate transporter-like MFS transporter